MRYGGFSTREQFITCLVKECGLDYILDRAKQIGEQLQEITELRKDKCSAGWTRDELDLEYSIMKQTLLLHHEQIISNSFRKVQ